MIETPLIFIQLGCRRYSPTRSDVQPFGSSTLVLRSGTRPGLRTSSEGVPRRLSKSRALGRRGSSWPMDWSFRPRVSSWMGKSSSGTYLRNRGKIGPRSISGYSMWLCRNQVSLSHLGRLCCRLTVETRNPATGYWKIRRTVTPDTPESPEPGGDPGGCDGYGLCWFHVNNEGRTKCIDCYHSGTLALHIIC